MYKGDTDKYGNKHGKGTLSYASNEIYTGDWVNDLRDGIGQYTFADGSIYNGEWKKDKIKYGTYTFYTGNSYTGGFDENGLRDGLGVLLNKNKDKFEGSFSQGKKHGLGKQFYKKSGMIVESKFIYDEEQKHRCSVTYRNGNKYQGPLNDDLQRHGNGVFTYECGDVVYGMYECNLLQGHATIVYSNGRRFEGLFQDDNMNGQGRMTYNNGDIYDGNYVDDVMSGYGTALFVSGERYEGFFENDCRNGGGVCKFENGDIYDGDWYDNGMHGQGKLVNILGFTYIGKFEANKKNGEGKYIIPGKAGGYIEGKWSNDVLKFGTYTYNNGDFYEGWFKNYEKVGRGLFTSKKYEYKGEFKGNKKCGKGVITYDDGTVYDGEWKNDLKHGKGKLTEVAGSIYEGDYVRGKRDGFGMQTSISGNIYKGHWYNDKKHGDGHLFYAANSNNIIGIWSNDRLVSREKEWKGDRNCEDIVNDIDYNNNNNNNIGKVKDILITEDNQNENYDDKFEAENNHQ